MLPFMVLAAFIIVQAFLLAITLMVAQVGAGHIARMPAAHASTRQAVPPPWQRGAHVSRRSSSITVRLASPMVIPGIPAIHVDARAGRRGA